MCFDTSDNGYFLVVDLLIFIKESQNFTGILFSTDLCTGTATNVSVIVSCRVALNI